MWTGVLKSTGPAGDGGMPDVVSARAAADSVSTTVVTVRECTDAGVHLGFFVGRR
jgi:hypothetical protein